MSEEPTTNNPDGTGFLRLRWVAVGLCIGVAIAATAWSTWWFKPAINRKGYNRIHEGMTLTEVSALLGRPPGNYSTREIRLSPNGPLTEATYWTQKDRLVSTGVTWTSDYGDIFVGFADDGRAVGKRLVEY